ncbi:anaerobic ribonucleoside-triphosphate reductase activating protein [Exiguobacterium sp. SH5S4]|uniref:anaerobic ribonucleoside-triphosphate reductase activating protein n=1 Tax=Exiguobacterium sp. SH5S4 TaxID=2510961 RepID=UPI003515A010
MDIKFDSVADGEGVRSVVFTAGCPHFCRGCHNPKSWNINNGEEMDINEIVERLEYAGHKKVTISGGDPFFQSNALSGLVKELRERDYDIWVYTGYTFDELKNMGSQDVDSILASINALVDGRFVESLKCPLIQYRGSSNQKILHLKDGLICKTS